MACQLLMPKPHETRMVIVHIDAIDADIIKSVNVQICTLFRAAENNSIRCAAQLVLTCHNQFWGFCENTKTCSHLIFTQMLDSFYHSAPRAHLHAPHGARWMTRTAAHRMHQLFVQLPPTKGPLSKWHIQTRTHANKDAISK